MRRKRPLADSRSPSPPLASREARPAVAALWRPWLLAAMTALLVARPLFPSESAATFGDGLTTVMLWIGLATFWLLGAIGRPFSFRFGWTDALLVLLVAWHAASALWAVAYGTPRPAMNMLWEWIGMGLCFLVARQLIDTAREARAMVAVMVALAVALSGYGLYQRAYEFPERQAEYAANPDRALRNAGLWMEAGSPGRKLFEDRLANAEPTATFALTNSLAGFLAPWLVMLAGVIVGTARIRRRANGDIPRPTFGRCPADTKIGTVPRRPWGMIAAMIPIAACLLLTKSRSGYAGACVGLLLVWLFSREKKFRIGWKLPAATLVVAALLISTAAVVEGPDVLGRASKSFGYRLQYWQSSLRMIAAHPWFGCGPGNFQEVYTQYKLPEASEEIADPHNFLLEIWATAGTPAALAFLGVLACFAWSMRGDCPDFCVSKNGTVPFGVTKSSNPQSPISNPSSANPSSDAWRHILLGGAIGLLLSVPLGMLSAAPPGTTTVRLEPFGHINVPTVVLLGLPLAVGTIVVLLAWIREGHLPKWLPTVGIIVLLIDLSASGGIGMPGVAGTLWLLLALGLQSAGGDAKCRPKLTPKWLAWPLLAGVVAVIGTCYATAYRPVLECQAQLRLAERKPEQAIEHLEAAAAADPLAAEPWRRLAEATLQAWRSSPTPAAFDRFERADAESTRLAPDSASAWAASGEWYFQAFSDSKGRRPETAADALAKAVAAYRRAARLYPTSALYVAELAEALDAAGDRSAFRREAETALRLDRNTPHADKKLPTDLRNRLLRGLGRTD